MRFRISKRLKNFSIVDLHRSNLQVELSSRLSIFPKMKIVFEKNEMIQFSEVISRKPINAQNPKLKVLWSDFIYQIGLMHQHKYVHGDILPKNIVFDGEQFRLIDHELRLINGRKLMVTFPWIDPEDFFLRIVTKRTDNICLEATYKSFFNRSEYDLFREKQMAALSESVESIQKLST